MAERRRGLGKGLGALIPPVSSEARPGQRPVDVFFTGGGGPAVPAYDDGAAGAEAARPQLAGKGKPRKGKAGTGGVAAAAAGEKGTSEKSGVAPDSAAWSSSEPELVQVPGASFAEIPLTQIRPNPKQPRTVFDDEALAELTESVRTVGLLQPVVVRPLDQPEGEARYELVMGERRWRAVRASGLEVIPAIVRETSETELLRDALLENLHRANLNPLEEAAAYQQMLDDFGCTQDELARQIARSRPQISNTLRLLKLPPLVQRRVAAGVLSAGHARALLGLSEAAAMERLAQRIVAEGLSVRATEETVAIGGSEAEASAPARRAPRAGGQDEAVAHLQDRLADRFDTRVIVNLGKRKGKVVIEFASAQDLNRILETLSPGDPGLRQ
jgi:ParB family chromosome partitioning protein